MAKKKTNLMKESRRHSLSDVRADRSSPTEHTAEIAVASHSAAEIE